MFDRIVVATDLTPISDGALRAALRLGRALRSKVIVLHVSERTHQAEHWLVPFFEQELKIYGDAVRREADVARALILEAVKRIDTEGSEAASVEAVVQSGRAADTIIRMAHEYTADLIVVGTHGRIGVLGSVAEHVARSADRPVLVIPGVRAD